MLGNAQGAPMKIDAYGKCHRNYTALRGKGEKVRQELTAPMATSVAGKPHPEQDQIAGKRPPGLVITLG
jgi:hypothetical protein